MSEGENSNLLGDPDASTSANPGERFTVVDTRAHQYCYLVNHVIKSYLELFRQPRAEAEALEELARQAGCSPEAIAATVRTFFQRMRRAGLLRSAEADLREESNWALTPGQVLGEYRVGELIVEKPDVALHHARQVGTGMPVVLKVFILRGPRARRELELFEREFSFMAGLAPHENVCRLLAFHPGDPCYAALEYAGGTPIRRAMSEDSLSLRERERIGAEALAALAHLHRHGFLHGDVHSRNFMLTDEHRVKLIDFGLSRRIGDPAEAASVPHGGLPGFMPPERIEPGSLSISSRPGDMRSEVFQLGVLLHEVLTGQEPFSKGVLWSRLAEAIRNQPAPRAVWTPGGERIPAALADVIERALAKAPEERFPSAVEMLESWRAARRRGARPVRTGERVRP
ncbi:serine/threonine protein kinase [Pyxidicoccus fallax]|uniref:Serine/threonine protein kinase n=1 Tax=Pyxidicoccus fallax TaxID=394095 RepID=A0A848LPS4_9BACT|nr:serine/threonine-protein kinase [Pyxidicoccus fallax]NMO19897.1 serine/threonine protein kinase [Pyxidicoccus fallax]NPC83108.1 serine/threonine protein kinase [Pyxidicoccus fallax]